jgi:tetratricopeptide (TPR) repeat protein
MAIRSPGNRCARYGLVVLAGWLCIHCGGGDPIEQARAFQAAGRLDEALAVLQPLMGQQNRDPEVLFLYGTTLRRKGRPGLGLWALRQSSLSPGWEIPAGLELGAAAFESRNYQVSLEAATRVLEREPDNLAALIIRAEARLEDRSDYEASLADYERAIELDPDNLNLRVSRVANLLVLERTDEAAEVIADLEALADEARFPEAARARFCVARAIFQRESGNLEIADADFAGCLERYPETALVVASAVAHYDETGRIEQGNELLDAYLERVPGSLPERSTLANRLSALGRIDEAEAVLREGTRLDGGFASAYAWAALAKHFAGLRRFSEAAEAYGRARELEGEMGMGPQRILAHAELYAMSQQNERALELAAQLDDHFYRDIIYAWVRLNERRPAEALEHLEVALALWPDNAAAHYYAARAAERIGDWPRAVDAYRNSIRSGAGETDAGLRLAELHRAQRRYSDALVALTHHQMEHPGDLDAALLGVEIAAELPGSEQLQAALARVPRGAPAEVAAVLADSMARKRGAEAAVDMLLRDETLDFEDPRGLPALAALVRHLREAGRAAEGFAGTDAALEKHPDRARLYEIRAGLLEGESSRQALERALELDPAQEDALVALAALAAREGDAEEALSLLARLGDPAPEVMLERARLLAEQGNGAEAQSLLEDLLWEWPHNVRGAMALAELRLRDPEGSDSRTLDLARRAVLFGGSAQAYTLLARVHEARGEDALAAEAREKAAESSPASEV